MPAADTAQLTNATQYQEPNRALFTERNAIKDQLAAVGDTDDVAARRARARLTSQLDRITAQIIELNYGLVRSYVKRFTSNTSAYDSEDFEGAGLVGLMRAIDTYNPDRGKFGSWAFKPIQREVLRAVRDSDHPNVSPSDFDKRPDILRAVTELQAGDDEYVPSLEEVAATAGVTIEQARRVLHAPRLDSISTEYGDGSTIGDTIADTAVAVDDLVLSSMDVAALTRFGLAALDERELFVLSRRFGLDCEPEQRLSAIGEILGLSREAIRQVESKALSKMRHPVTLRQILSQGA
jgi:RNA polymerase sigma factor (sigma-70 family)